MPAYQAPALLAQLALLAVLVDRDITGLFLSRCADPGNTAARTGFSDRFGYQVGSIIGCIQLIH